MSQPTGLYGWIQSNDAKSAVFFVGFVVAVQVIATLALFIPLAFGDPGHAPIFNWPGYAVRYTPLVLAASAIWFVCQMIWQIESVKRAVNFHFIDGADEPRLCRVIEPLIIMMGLPSPYVGVIESRARNAFACGIARKKAVVVVTRGLIESLNDEELACVLAHELSHIKNGDIRLMAAANIFMSALTWLHRKNGLRMTPVHMLLAIAIPVVLPLTLLGTFIGHVALRVGQVSRLLISSSREFIADAEAVQLTKNPAALAAALVKVEHNYRVENARREDDAMMIAGDIEGANATHPTVVQRIAALARTTGSMVFNAPSAALSSVWNVSTTLREAESAALLRKMPRTRALPRVSALAQENMFGLTRWQMVMTAVTISALLLLHADELGNPRAILAKFDIAPLTLLVQADSACQNGLLHTPVSEDCTKTADWHFYRNFENQRNTLAGWLADISRKRREAGFVSPDLTLHGLGEPSYVRRAYPGQSGQLAGTIAESTDRGLYQRGYGGFTNVVPQHLHVAEIKSVGCFPAKLLHGEPTGHFPLDKEVSGVIGLRRLIEEANDSLIGKGQPGTPAADDWLRNYARTRESMTLFGYDSYGLPGLRKLSDVYRSEAHGRVVDLIRGRLSDPSFTRGLDRTEAAKLEALARAPDRFLPCPAVKHGALDAAAVKSN